MLLWFQSSPVPEDGCNEMAQMVREREQGFNPHPSRRTGATFQRLHFHLPERVSILTRPGGRVQLKMANDNPTHRLFQSSPVPEDGCNQQCNLSASGGIMFQSSPVPEDGCNE